MVGLQAELAHSVRVSRHLRPGGRLVDHKGPRDANPCLSCAPLSYPIILHRIPLAPQASAAPVREPLRGRHPSWVGVSLFPHSQETRSQVSREIANDTAEQLGGLFRLFPGVPSACTVSSDCELYSLLYTSDQQWQ